MKGCQGVVQVIGKRLIGLLFIASLLSACVESNAGSTLDNTNSSDGPPAPVEVTGECAVEGQFPDTTTCITLSVTCEDLPPATAELRITPNGPGTTYVGIIVLGTGGAGRSFIAGDAPLPGLPPLKIVHQLAAAGYKVVERKWQTGWFGEGSEGLGIITPSCRYAELLKWLHDQETTPGAFCAYGNSGGASEIAYGLTRWHTEEILDAAIISGGPPMARLDTGCLGFQNDPAWEQRCTEVWNNTQTQCGSQAPVCTLYDREGALGPLEIDVAFSVAGLENLCTASSTTFSDVFLENSILFPGADVGYPNTAVHFIFGRQDCTESATLGTLYLDAITTEKSVTYLDDVPHEIQDSENGVIGIVDAITDHCTISP